ncbi:hypothetical protein [Deinococcus roseus]|uniref:Uncharacterized protein n=1 Tax=Deinococcus roseus TaxID=392414 RepID=A0ABQ2D0K4_9DEIO|nr:hypothetical protein [Deinococcus roseus]GGJ39065.1 hypothetical protein GCM10008938_26340 [Deinococcus roseus]
MRFFKGLFLVLTGCSVVSAAPLSSKTLAVLGSKTRIVTQYKTQFRTVYLLHNAENNLYAYVAQSSKNPAEVGGCVLRPEKQVLKMQQWIKKDGPFTLHSGKKFPVYDGSLYIQLANKSSGKLLYDGVVYGYPYNTYDFEDLYRLVDCVRSKPQ